MLSAGDDSNHQIHHLILPKLEIPVMLKFSNKQRFLVLFSPGVVYPVKSHFSVHIFEIKFSRILKGITWSLSLYKENL